MRWLLSLMIIISCGSDAKVIRRSKACTVTQYEDRVEIECPDGTKSTIYNGKDGIDGRDGKDGVDGRDGKDGVDGRDGTSVKLCTESEND